MIVTANCVSKWLVRVAFLVVLLTQALLLGNYLVYYLHKSSAHAYILTYIPAVVLWIRGQIGNKGRTVAAAVWLLYSIPLTGITGWIFGQLLPKINNNSMMDAGFLKNVIAMSALVFLLLDAQKYHPRLFMDLNWLKALDILDAADFVGMLFQEESSAVPGSFQRTVLSFGLLGLVLTTISLVSLQNRNSYQITDDDDDMQPSVPLETTRLLLQVLLVNFPFCALRVFLWHVYKVDLSVFTFKNVLAIAVDLIQIAGQSLENRLISTADTNEVRSTGSRLSRRGSRTLVDI